MCIELYRWSIELEGIFVLPLARRWDRHSYLLKKATNDPLYLLVISSHLTFQMHVATYRETAWNCISLGAVIHHEWATIIVCKEAEYQEYASTSVL